MMELERRDGRNYVVYECAVKEADTLAMNMLKRNVCRRLLPLSFRYVDESVLTEHDITGVQPLTRIYSRRKLCREDMEELAGAVAEAAHQLCDLLLGPENLYLDPGMIFACADGHDIRFCLNLSASQEADPFRALLSFILDRADYSDKEAVTFAYSLAKAAEGGDPVGAMKRLVTGGHEEDEVPADGRGGDIREGHFLRALPENSGAGKKGILKRLFDRSARRRQLMLDAGVFDDPRSKERFVTGPIDETHSGRRYFLLPAPGGDTDRVELDRFPFVFGKLQGDADHVLRSHAASRLHAEITFEEEILYIRDLNSSNGTFVNGEILSGGNKRPLSDGDRIAFADEEYRLEIYLK